MYEEEVLYRLPNLLTTEEMNWYWLPAATSVDTLFVMRQPTGMKPEALVMVEKIAKAIGRSKENLAILVLGPDQHIGGIQVIQSLQPSYVINFGCAHTQLMMQYDVAPHVPATMGQWQYLCTYAPDTLQDKTELRAGLWHQLQKMYRL